MRHAKWGLGLSIVLVGCGPEGDRERVQKTKQEIAAPLAEAFCNVQVDGIGSVAMETDYLPHVIQCENGGANLQALKAQAIAARSVAYYNMASQGSICDGQGCQVYSCGATPGPEHLQAVAETSGQYLSFDDTLTYGFYVAGDNNVSPPGCVGVSGATEHYVTYNEGKSGNDVEQTTLGYVGPPGFGQNRGCMSQWGARCLENHNGYDALGILRFFYGADIGILTAPGPCVTPTTPELDAKVVSQSANPESVCTSAALTFEFEVENTGTAAWSDANGSNYGESIRLGVPDDSNDPFVGGNRISLNESTNPSVDPVGGDCNDQAGCKRTVFRSPAGMTAPPVAGIYTTRWRMVDEGRAWFGPEMSLTVEVKTCAGQDGGGASGGSGAGGPGQSTTLVEDDEGCGCRAAGGTGRASSLSFLVLGLAALVRRSRRERLTSRDWLRRALPPRPIRHDHP
jgi:MYXO-CTERM domain-containing protein